MSGARDKTTGRRASRPFRWRRDEIAKGFTCIRDGRVLSTIFRAAGCEQELPDPGDADALWHFDIFDGRNTLRAGEAPIYGIAAAKAAAARHLRHLRDINALPRGDLGRERRDLCAKLGTSYEEKLRQLARERQLEEKLRRKLGAPGA